MLNTYLLVSSTILSMFYLVILYIVAYWGILILVIISSAIGLVCMQFFSVSCTFFLKNTYALAPKCILRIVSALKTFEFFSLSTIETLISNVDEKANVWIFSPFSTILLSKLKLDNQTLQI